jgi:hypothetical protein
VSPYEAGVRVLALVCGFAGDHALKRQLLMLTAYIDASGKGDPSLLVLAGYVATAEAWIEFSKEWQSRLDEVGIPYFKMREMAGRPEIAGWFYRVIEEHDIKAALSCVIKTDELVKVNRGIRYPAYIVNTEMMENPYYFAFKAIIDVLAQQQVKLGLTEPVDFIFDEELEKRRVLEGWDLMKANSAPEFAALMGDTPAYRDDKKLKPLQAADLYAWWILKWERDKREEWARDLPFPWGIKKDIPRLAMSFGERDFWIEASKGLAKFARNVGDLMYALSLLPPEQEQSS